MTESPAGFLNVFKPVGMTSHDVVAFVRRATGAKTGHAGTLDPAACGVLALLLNKATKLSSEVMALKKTYRAEVTFGLRTSTGDAEGEVVETSETQPDSVRLSAAIGKFIGEIEQTPPMAAAVKVEGRRLYELARKGIEIERKPRKVRIDRIETLDFHERAGRRRALLEISCSGGTYIRTLAEDIGREVGSAACLSFLIRTAIGPFAVADSVRLDTVPPDELISRILSPEVALPRREE